MQLTRKISNEEYEAALQNEEYMKILWSAANRYRIKHIAGTNKRIYIEQAEVKQLVHLALWKALSNFNPSKNTSFLTYLYVCVKWLCVRYIADEEKYENLKTIARNKYPIQQIGDEYQIRSMDSQTGEILARRMDGYTYLEIGRFYGRSVEWARTNCLKGMEELKLAHLDQ